MISVEQLSKSYGNVEALRGISFEVARGEIIGLLGPNGAGKTTCMKILTGYLQPTGGSARIDGIDVVADPLAVQGMIGYLPENAPIYLDMAVQEYLLMMAELRGISEERRRSLLSDAIHATGLEPHLTRSISDLSKGYRQRVGLAQAIMHQPKVLVLDEPTNGLDPTQIIEIRELIRRLAEHSTVIVSTHILSEVEATAHRAIIIMNGQIKADARLDQLTSATSALVEINSDATGIEAALSTLPGVSHVSQEGPSNGFARYRVSAARGIALTPMIFDLAKERGWRLAELHHESRTLESVFRELAEKEGVKA
ncbi:MAG: ATP-binding cassette domain-containing protein [Deltaproteobacteria bacterium]|nr:ATP-binding cassette domain-containing protein [Deltaproteobacteria bacterium]